MTQDPWLDPTGPGRVQRVALHFGARLALHVVQIYGFADGSSGALAANEALVTNALLWLAGLDFNFDLGASPIWAPAHMAGWRDLGAGAGSALAGGAASLW